jgi:hypothetical protein
MVQAPGSKFGPKNIYIAGPSINVNKKIIENFHRNIKNIRVIPTNETSLH